ncbi:ABC transporter ATP-binding protein [Aliidiomarina halalkaliphila]|uniref:ABC transporter ATP-binding protein n=1 Tax=Aliidiomarina halalkaliphila TaxID=2593535 RepID=A0A552X274_9GAMM|nr:ABC transporter ATP-binding protein [Aliidiomarina halalkaliphila]TRW48703.1 ABC transporter ATP-binding protein [Aliidiomarina halalkaliphila]
MNSYILDIQNLSKQYPSGHKALNDVSLQVERGKILALLGPNGAGKTTLISIVCGLVKPGPGSIQVDGLDVIRDYREVRKKIGLVPQELSVSMFETVWDTVTLSRGMFGKPADPVYLESLLRELSLWDKRKSKIMTLSGGMKRRVLIAKALSHQPDILFLDEPTAGVDVELRRDMWGLIRRLRDNGVTIILTTHYIEEAEEMADRIGVINKGELILVEEKNTLMTRLGSKNLILELAEPIQQIPEALAPYGLTLSKDGAQLVYTYDSHAGHEISVLLRALQEQGIEYRDLHTRQSSLEDIFVNLVAEGV